MDTELRYAQIRSMLLLLALALLAGAAPITLHAQLVWVAQGPAPATGGQVEGIADGEVVGAVNTVALHPTDPSIAFIGTVNGGIWRTNRATDPHPAWEAQTDHQPSLSIGSLEFDPSDSTHRTLVAGMGRASSNARQGGARSGLLRTVDAGATWTAINGGGSLNGLNITGVAPRGATTVICVNDADQPARNGIWSSPDTGASWTQTSGGRSGPPAGACTDLASDPMNTDRLFANAGRAGVYRSTDRGLTWMKVSDAALDGAVASAVNVKISVGRANNIYVAVVGASRQLSAVYRSGNGGSTWAAMDLPQTREGGIHPGRQGGIHLSIAADSTNSDVVYIGGDAQPGPIGGRFPAPNSIGAKDYSGRLFRGDASKPAGSQWVHLTHAQNAAGGGTAHGSAPHADSRDMGMAVDGTLVEVDDGGIYRRTSPRSNAGDWFSMIGDLQATEFHAVAWDANAHIAIGGAQDTGTPQQESRSRTKWKSVSTSDGGVVVVDATSTPGLSVRYSSFYDLLGFRRRVYTSAGTFQSEQFLRLTPLNGDRDVEPQFYTPLALNAVTPTRLVVGAENAVYESFDQGDTAAAIGPGIRANANSIAYGARGNADMLYVGTGSGVFVRTGARPASLDRSATYPGGEVAAIAIDPQEPRTAFVIDASAVYRTTDAGATWTTVTGNLAAFSPGPLRSAAYSSATAAGAVVVGSDTGVFEAAGPGFSSWHAVGSGLPRAPIYHLEYSAADRTLLAGTLGRGAWTLTIPPAPPPLMTLPAGAAAAQPPPAGGSSAVQLRPGVVVDPAARRVFIATPQGAIDSLNVADGTRVWTSRLAARPLGIVERRLVAQTESVGADNALRMSILDAATGREVERPRPIELPPGVRPAIGDTPEGRFALAMEAAGNDAVVSWRFDERPIRGVRPGTGDALSDPLPAPPPPPGVPSTGSERLGAFRVNVANGAVLPADLVRAAAPPPPGVALSAVPQPLAGLPPTQVLSADGKHILASERIADESTWDKYQWTIVNRQTGEHVGQLRSHVAVAPFNVSDSVLLFETAPYTRQTAAGLVQEPLKIRAVDFATGKAWNREIRDTSLRGPFPP